MTTSGHPTYPNPTIQDAIDEVDFRPQRLFHFIERAKQSQEIEPQTAAFAWDTWGLLNNTLSKALSVPDASYGPDGQFLFIWDKGEHHLELEIEPSGQAYFFYRNRSSGALWDSDYKVGEPLSHEIIEKLREVA